MVVVVTAGWPPNAWSNDASFGGCGGVLASLAGEHACQPIANPDIELVEEELRFVLQPGGSGPSFGGLWLVEGRYVLHNHGDAQIVTIGFPIQEAWGEEFRGTGEGHPVPFEHYRVTLDGAEVSAELFIAEEDGDVAACAAAEQYGYSHAYLSEVAFGAGETVTLVHSFEHPTGSNFYGYVWFNYILKTGGLWRGGRIGKAKISLEVQEPMAPCFAASIPGGQAAWDAQRFTWLLEDFAPTDDFSVVLVLSRVASFFELGFVEEAEGLDSEAIEALGYSDQDLLHAYLNVMALYRQSVPTLGVPSMKKQKREKGYGDTATCQGVFPLEPEVQAKLYGSDGRRLEGWESPMSGVSAPRAGPATVPERVHKQLAVLAAELRRRGVDHPVLRAPRSGEP